MANHKPLDWMARHEKPPEYLSSYSVQADPRDNFDETDVSWPGAFAELDEEQLKKLEASLAEPERSLRHILHAMVQGHADHDVEQRVEAALSAVTNTPRRAGNTTIADDEAILVEMGRLFFRRSFGFEVGSIAISDIAIEAYQNIRPGDLLTSNSKDSFQRRLRRKFKQDIDRWCYAAAERQGLTSRRQSDGLRNTLAALKRLDVPVRSDGHKPTN